jgi:hypothetical protein
MFDDLFEKSKQNRNTGQYGHDNRHDKYGPDSYGRDNYGNGSYGHYNPLLNIARKILRNKVLLAAIVFIILIIGAVGVWIIIQILPYLGQVVSMAEKQGIKGIQDMIPPFLQKIWEGAGK